MNRLIYLNEILGQAEWKEITFAIYTTADASFDEKNSQLVVKLESSNLSRKP